MRPNNVKETLRALWLSHRTMFVSVNAVLILVSIYMAGRTKRSMIILGNLADGTQENSLALIDNMARGIDSPLTVLIFYSLLFIVAYKIMSIFAITDGDRLNYHISDRDDNGSAREMTDFEAEQYFIKTPIEKAPSDIIGYANKKARTVYCFNAKATLIGPNPHVALCGSSGRGKTTNYILTKILQCVRMGESIVATDTSGEIPTFVYRYIEKHGYTVRILNLINPAHSDGFNPLDLLKLDVGSKENAALQFASLMIANYAPGRESEFFSQETERFMSWLPLYVQDNLAEAYALLSMDQKSMIQRLKQVDSKNPAYLSIKSFVGADTTQRSRMINGMLTVLKGMIDPAVVNLLSHSDIDIELPGKEKCAYFVSVPITQKANNWIASMFYGCMFIALMDGLASKKEDKRLDVPVTMIMDEFQSIFNIPNFSSILNNCRKNGIKITMSYQDNNGLEKKFPENEWRSVLGACDTQIFMGTNDLRTAKDFSDMTGEGTTEVDTFNTSFGATLSSGRVSTSKRMIRTPDEMMRDKSGRPYVFPKEAHFKEMDSVYWKEHPDYPEVERCGTYNVAEHKPYWIRNGEAPVEIETYFNRYGGSQSNDNAVKNFEEQLDTAEENYRIKNGSGGSDEFYADTGEDDFSDGGF